MLNSLISFVTTLASIISSFVPTDNEPIDNFSIGLWELLKAWHGFIDKRFC